MFEFFLFLFLVWFVFVLVDFVVATNGRNESDRVRVIESRLQPNPVMGTKRNREC